MIVAELIALLAALPQDATVLMPLGEDGELAHCTEPRMQTVHPGEGGTDEACIFTYWPEAVATEEQPDD